MADTMPLVARIMVQHGGGGPPTGPGMASQGDSGGDDKETKTIRKKTLAVTKELVKGGRSHIAKTLGIQVGIASILKQSQVFTGYIGTIFQLMGALVDVILAPFLPILIPAIKLLASFIPIARDLMKGTVDWLIKTYHDVVGWLADHGIKLGRLPKAFAERMKKVIAAILISVFLAKLVGFFKLLNRFREVLMRSSYKVAQLSYNTLRAILTNALGLKPVYKALMWMAKKATTPGSIFVFDAKNFIGNKANAAGLRTSMMFAGGMMGRGVGLAGRAVGLLGRSLKFLKGAGSFALVFGAVEALMWLMNRGNKNIEDAIHEGSGLIRAGTKLDENATLELRRRQIPLLTDIEKNTKGLIESIQGAWTNIRLGLASLLTSWVDDLVQALRIGKVATPDPVAGKPDAESKKIDDEVKKSEEKAKKTEEKANKAKEEKAKADDKAQKAEKKRIEAEEKAAKNRAALEELENKKSSKKIIDKAKKVLQTQIDDAARITRAASAANEAKIKADDNVKKTAKLQQQADVDAFDWKQKQEQKKLQKIAEADQADAARIDLEAKKTATSAGTKFANFFKSQAAPYMDMFDEFKTGGVKGGLTNIGTHIADALNPTKWIPNTLKSLAGKTTPPSGIAFDKALNRGLSPGHPAMAGAESTNILSKAINKVVTVIEPVTKHIPKLTSVVSDTAKIVPGLTPAIKTVSKVGMHVARVIPFVATPAEAAYTALQMKKSKEEYGTDKMIASAVAGSIATTATALDPTGFISAGISGAAHGTVALMSKFGLFGKKNEPKADPATVAAAVATASKLPLDPAFKAALNKPNNVTVNVTTGDPWFSGVHATSQTTTQVKGDEEVHARSHPIHGVDFYK